jgi:hypothetical protein
LAHPPIGISPFQKRDLECFVSTAGRTLSRPFCSVNGKLTAEQTNLVEKLWQHVNVLAGDIGEKNLWHYQNLAAAADYIEAALTSIGYGRLSLPVLSYP